MTMFFEVECVAPDSTSVSSSLSSIDINSLFLWKISLRKRGRFKKLVSKRTTDRNLIKTC